MEHPDRQQGIVGVGHIHVDVLGNGVDLAVAAGGGVERIGRGVVHPAVGALGTGIGILVIPVGQIAGQVGRGEGLQVAVIKGLNGIHVGVGHFAGAVHRHLGKGGRALAAHIVVLGGGHHVIALAVALGVLALVPAACVGLGIVKPEGDIYALDLRDVVLALERLGQEGLALVISGQLGDGGLFVQLEGQDVFRLQLAGELAAQHRGVAAVGAGGGSGGLVTDQLGSAGGAGVAVQALCLGLAPHRAVLPGQAGGFFGIALGGSVGSGLLFGVAGLDVLYVVGRAAVIADQLAAGTIVVQGAGAGRALIIRCLFSHASDPSQAPKGLPHSGQNLGGLAGSAGTKPQLAHLAAGRGLPHSEQNLPLFFAPQLHTQTAGASGRGLPHSAQNLPVLPVWPQLQVQPAAGAA